LRRPCRQVARPCTILRRPPQTSSGPIEPGLPAYDDAKDYWATECCGGPSLVMAAFIIHHTPPVFKSSVYSRFSKPRRYNKLMPALRWVLFLPCAAQLLGAPPIFTLPGGVTPLKHSVELTIDPDQSTFDGRMRI